MPSKSKKQQRFFGMVRGCQKTGNCPSDAVKKAAKSTSADDASHFASKTENFKEWLAKNESWMLGSPDDYQPHGLGSDGGMGTARAADPGAGGPVPKKKEPKDDILPLGDIGNFKKKDEALGRMGNLVGGLAAMAGMGGAAQADISDFLPDEKPAIQKFLPEKPAQKFLNLQKGQHFHPYRYQTIGDKMEEIPDWDAAKQNLKVYGKTFLKPIHQTYFDRLNK